MRLTSVGSAALLSAVVISLTAPAAMAGDNGNITSFGFSVSPASVAPGGTVTLSANGCEVPSVTASSGVFDTVTLEEGHSATARVDPDARVGAQYDVTFECKGETGTTPPHDLQPLQGRQGRSRRIDHRDEHHGTGSGRRTDRRRPRRRDPPAPSRLPRQLLTGSGKLFTAVPGGTR